MEAEAYDRHVGRYGAQLASGLVDVAGLRAGQRALDVGCGPGALTQVLADLLGAANVAAVDPFETYVEACRARVPGADVRRGAAEELPFATGEFDAVLAQLVVQLMDDRDAGVREMARVARPGGVVAACVWDSRTMPLLRSFWDAALAVAPERASETDDAKQVGYERAGELAELFEASRLVEVSAGELLVQADYESFDDLFGPFTTGVGRSGACFAALEGGDQRRLRSQTQRALGVPDGPFTLTARVWWARGLAPGP